MESDADTLIFLRRPAARGRIVVSVCSGEDAGRTMVFERGRISIGAAPDNDFVLAEPTVSRNHCALELRAEGLLLVDLGSRNGSVVHGVRVRECLLPPSSHVQLGRCLLHVREAGVAGAGDEAETEARDIGPIVCRSPAMHAPARLIKRLLGSDAAVFIHGEAGAGKALVASTIHGLGSRADRSLTAVRCAEATPESLEAAIARARVSCGTLLLDEIAALPLFLQARLLRAIEGDGGGSLPRSRFRIITCSQMPLAQVLESGRLRTELSYHLGVISLEVPPLRARREDIRPLVEHFLACVWAPAELVDAIDFAALERAAWPGNVSELKRAVRRAAAFGDAGLLAEQAALSGVAAAAGGRFDGVSYQEARQRVLAEFEQEYLSEMLTRAGGNVSEAARRARMDRGHLRTLAEKHQLARRARSSG